MPLGSFVANDLILSRQFVGGGSMYIGDGASALPKIELSTGVILSRFNIFQNPVAYFSTSTNTVVKWDLNCKTPYYNSCTLNG